VARYFEIAAGVYLVACGGLFGLYFLAMAAVSPYLSGDIWSWVHVMGPLGIAIAIAVVGVGFLIGRRRRQMLLARARRIPLSSN
jgi:hypothetical protein